MKLNPIHFLKPCPPLGRVFLDTTNIQGRAELPLCPYFTDREQNQFIGKTDQSIDLLVLAERQLRPTLVVVASSQFVNTDGLAEVKVSRNTGFMDAGGKHEWNPTN